MLAALVLRLSMASAADVPTVPEPAVIPDPAAAELPARLEVAWHGYQRSRRTYRAGMATTLVGASIVVLGVGSGAMITQQGRWDVGQPLTVMSAVVGGLTWYTGTALALGGSMRGRTHAMTLTDRQIGRGPGVTGWAMWGVGLLYFPTAIASSFLPPFQWRLNEKAMRPHYVAEAERVRLRVTVLPTGLVGSF